MSLAVLLIYINCWHHNEHPVVWWFHFTFKVRLLFFLIELFTLIENSIKDSANSSISAWMKLTFLMITFFLTNNIISLLLMWILWNESARKCLHTLLNCLWELVLLFFKRIWWDNYRYMQYQSSLKTSS